ncbi:integrase [Gossypium australe]|uniref:Integrase n=1 Tax=Gossypium australe TaxID=47621 RepID=A0A5B6X1W0_9ROSI|nr:integrase [Gossypium australe]
MIQPESMKDNMWFIVKCLIPVLVVVAYLSRQLKSHKCNYSTHDLDLATVRRWIELLKDYDCTIEYHLRKANVAVDVLSRRLMTVMRAMFAKLSLSKDRGFLVELQIKPILVDEIKMKQPLDTSLVLQIKQVEEGKTTKFRFNSNGVLCYHGRYCSIHQEAHSSPYTVYSRRNKIYQDLRELYCWSSLKCEVIEFVAKCLTCQQVKAQHQFPSGLL